MSLLKLFSTEHALPWKIKAKPAFLNMEKEYQRKLVNQGTVTASLILMQTYRAGLGPSV